MGMSRVFALLLPITRCSTLLFLLLPVVVVSLLLDLLVSKFCGVCGTAFCVAPNVLFYPVVC